MAHQRFCLFCVGEDYAAKLTYQTSSDPPEGRLLPLVYMLPERSSIALIVSEGAGLCRMYSRRHTPFAHCR